MFKPRSIAVVGASERTASTGRIILRNVLAAGFPSDQTYVVRAGATTFDGVRSVPSGIFDTVVEAHPELSRACERLRDQHRAILGELQALSALLPPGPAGPADPAWSVRLRRVLVELEAHEQQENGMLLEADGETGAGD